MQKKSKTPLSAYLTLVCGLVTIGFSAIFVRLAAAPGTVSAFYRMAIGSAIILIPFLIQLSGKRFKLPSKGVFYAVLGGTFFAMDLALWSTGVVMSGATNPTLLANTAPLWVALGSILLFKERHGLIFWLGLILALTGAALVLGVDISRSNAFGLGTFLGLLAALFYGSFYLATQRGRKLLDTLSYFAITTITSALVLLVINIMLDQELTGYSPNTYLIFFAMGIIVQVTGWLLLNYSQGHLRAAIVSPTLLGQPVVTAIFSFILLGELFSFWQLVGGVVVLTGIFIVHRS